MKKVSSFMKETHKRCTWNRNWFDEYFTCSAGWTRKMFTKGERAELLLIKCVSKTEKKLTAAAINQQQLLRFFCLQTTDRLTRGSIVAAVRVARRRYFLSFQSAISSQQQQQFQLYCFFILFVSLAAVAFFNVCLVGSGNFVAWGTQESSVR